MLTIKWIKILSETGIFLKILKPFNLVSMGSNVMKFVIPEENMRDY